MHKVYTLVAAIGLVMLGATTSSAATFSTTDGDVFTVPTTNVPGAAVFEFKPSPKVNMTGQSSSIGFAHDAVHMSALGVSGGQSYGMAGDTNKVFFKVVETSGDVLYTIATSNSTFSSAGSFTQMQ